jgi:hypothetical protein
MPFNPNTHNVVKTREGTMPAPVTPHILLTSEHGQMIIQDGQWYDAGGVEVDDEDVPDWAWETAKTFSNETRESLGLEPLGPSDAAKNVSKRPSINVDQQASGNPPMQLGAQAAETDGKATPVPQDGEPDPAAKPGAKPPAGKK